MKKKTAKKPHKPASDAVKTGRPLIQIDWAVVEDLCSIQCTAAEIASFLRCSEDTIERAVQREQGMPFAQYFELHRGAGKVSLRRAQYQTALSGNPAMLIWLGKQWLGQTEPKQHLQQDVSVRRDVTEMSNEELEAIAKRAKAELMENSSAFTDH